MPAKRHQHRKDRISSSTESLETKRQYIYVIGFAIIVFLIYSNTFNNPFAFDDLPHILDNPKLRLTDLTYKSIHRATFEKPMAKRPVSKGTFALNYYFDKYNVFGYHLVNIVIHYLNALLLYLFLKSTLDILAGDRKDKSDHWIPIFATILWIVHPMHTQSVTYIYQRTNSLCTLFYMLSFLFYIRARCTSNLSRKRMLFSGCVVAGLLALGSKEIAATLPFFILLYEWYFFQNLSITWLKRRLPFLGGLLVITCLFVIGYLGDNPMDKILSVYEKRNFTLTQRVLTEFRVVIFYIGLLIFPHPSRLNLDHDFNLSYGLFDPLTTFYSAMVIAGAIAVAVVLARRERLISFGIIWFFGNLAIESSVIGLELVFEHRTYLPSMLMSLMFVVILCRLVKPRWPQAAIICLIAVLFSVWTYQRNRVWRDDVMLYEDCIKKSPNKARPYVNLGAALGRKGLVQKAEAAYRKALQLDNNKVGAHNNLGNILSRKGLTQDAIAHYREAVRIKPDYELGHFNLAVALQREGRLEKAIFHYQQAIKYYSNYTKAHLNLALLLHGLGRLQPAMEHYSEVLRHDPDMTVVRKQMLEAMKQLNEAGKNDG